MKKLAAGLFLVAIFVASCSKDGGLWYSHNWENLHPNGQSAAATCTDTVGTISYSVTVQPIITSNCQTSISCHVNHGGALNYSNFANVQADATAGSPNDIMTRITLPTSNVSHMPQNTASLSTCDIAKIRIWIAQGAANN